MLPFLALVLQTASASTVLRTFTGSGDDCATTKPFSLTQKAGEHAITVGAGCKWEKVHSNVQPGFDLFSVFFYRDTGVNNIN